MNKPFIVAEMSANHLGRLDRALAIVEAAADAGADAVKLQTWVNDTMCIDQGYTLDRGPWKGKRLFDLYREAYLPWQYHRPIFERCAQRGIECFSAPFDQESVDFLERLGCPRYKIASFELTDLPLIRYVASKGKPMILSTGMATYEEIAVAVQAAARSPSITVLKCTSAYPADASGANLAAMRQLERLGCEFGLSDHSPGIGVAVAAAALGAVMIEKHLTLSRADGGPDAGFSMEPAEFRQTVIECRRAAAAIGQVQFGSQPGEDVSLRRSLWTVREISEGEMLRFGENVRTARPAHGLPPSFDLTGKRAACAIAANTPLTLPMLT